MPLSLVGRAAGLQGEESACSPMGSVFVGDNDGVGQMSPRSQSLIFLCPRGLVNPFSLGLSFTLF